MANGQFAELANRFVFVNADTLNGKSVFALEMSLKRNTSYFLVFDQEGNEIGRLDHQNMEFDDELVRLIEALERQFYLNQDELVDFLITRLDPAKPEDAAIEILAEGLDSPTYATRESSRRALIDLGEPALLFLENNPPVSAESRRQAKVLLKILNRYSDFIDRNQLVYDVEFLARHASRDARLLSYLHSILPIDVEFIDGDELAAWWKENGHSYTWNDREQRYESSNQECESSNQECELSNQE